jgi:ubiquitin-protein ligase
MPDYPFTSPKLQLLDHMYHPNINPDGKICSRLVNDYDLYNPAISISDIIKNVEQLISSFDKELVINMDVYQQYQNDREEFNQKVLDFILHYGHPRT